MGSMAGGTTVNQLKEQLESTQAENKAVQNQVDERLDQMPSSINSLTAEIEEWMKESNNGTPTASSTTLAKEY